MAKTKKSRKKPKAAAAKPSKAAAKPSKASAKPSKARPKAKLAKKPAPAARHAKPSPAARSAKAAPAVRPVKEAPAKNAKRTAAAIPIPIVVLDVPKTLAPGKFRREYKRWKDLLISLRHRLLQEGSHLEEEGLKALEQEVSVDHMADFGSDSYEQETTLQLIETNSLSLRDVDNALKRIEQGTYGLCEDCESLIPSARLTVLPHARYCIACQSKREGVAS